MVTNQVLSRDVARVTTFGFLFRNLVENLIPQSVERLRFLYIKSGYVGDNLQPLRRIVRPTLTQTGFNKRCYFSWLNVGLFSSA